MTLGMLFDTEGRLILERVDVPPTRQAEISFGGLQERLHLCFWELSLP